MADKIIDRVKRYPSVNVKGAYDVVTRKPKPKPIKAKTKPSPYGKPKAMKVKPKPKFKGLYSDKIKSAATNIRGKKK